MKEGIKGWFVIGDYILSFIVLIFKASWASIQKI